MNPGAGVSGSFSDNYSKKKLLSENEPLTPSPGLKNEPLTPSLGLKKHLPEGRRFYILSMLYILFNFDSEYHHSVVGSGILAGTENYDIIQLQVLSCVV